MTYKVQKIEQTGVVYADPADAGLSVRFKQSEQGKTLSGVPVTNHVTEVIVNDDNAVTINGVAATDAISIRLRVSASTFSKARVKALLVALAADVDGWADEDVFGGFRPVTAPSSPV